VRGVKVREGMTGTGVVGAEGAEGVAGEEGMLKEGRGMPTGGDAMVVVGAGAGIAWPVPKPTFVYGVNPPNSVGG